MDLPQTDWSKVADSVTEDQPRFAQDSKLYVQFYTRPMMKPRQSEEAGRPIYVDVDHIRIMVPGDKLNMIDRVASEDDKTRFAEHWGKYAAGQAQQTIGTQLESVPFMPRSKVEEYKYFGIHTVEQLSQASDEVGQKFPGFQDDKRKCLKFLEAANGTDARVVELERIVAELLSQKEKKDDALATLTAAPPKSTRKQTVQPTQ